MKRSFIQIIVVGAVVICVIDTALSVLSLQSQIPYSSFFPVSAFIYGIFGFFSARRADFILAPLCGAMLGFIDATIGWFISWKIGPGDPGVELGSVEIGSTIVFVTAIGAIFGSIGGLLAKLVTPKGN